MYAALMPVLVDLTDLSSICRPSPPLDRESLEPNVDQADPAGAMDATSPDQVDATLPDATPPGQTTRGYNI